MSKPLTRTGMAVMTLSAMGVALYSLRYLGVLLDHWALVDPGIRGVIERVPVEALTHMVIAPLALLLGPFQFMPRLRARYPRLHRYSGRVYVASCVIAGIAAFGTAFHASGGPVAGWGFGLLAVAWIATTLAGWWAAIQHRLELHRVLMRLSYAMTFGAVTLRLQIPIGLMLGYTSYPQMSMWLAYTSWIPNVLVVGLYSALKWQRAAGTWVNKRPLATS